MSGDFKFGVDDVGGDAERAESNESNVDGSALKEGFSFTGLVLMPLTILAVFAFIQKATVVSALTAMFGGAAGLAVAVATAAWVVGAIIVGVIGLIVVATVVALLTGIVKRSGAQFGLGLLGAIYLAIGSAGATYLFGNVPFLVGFMLTTTLLSWGAILVIGGIVIIGAIVLA